jgi:cardiolipin synthase
MTLVTDLLILLAFAVLALLLYLILFERGTFYGTSQPVHGLTDAERLRVLSTLLGTPVQSIAHMVVLREGPELYRRQIAAIGNARHSVHLEAYIFHPGHAADAIVNALCLRARAGVKVRVMIDAVGSWRTPHRQFADLREAGAEVHRYHPLRWQLFRRWNSRTHRNLLIIDGECAFIGGAGIADHWSRTEPAPWRDTILRVEGPVVSGLQSVFAENWLECAGELLVGPEIFPVLPTADEGILALAVGSTPTAGGSTKARTLVQFLLASSRDRIDMCTPYFIPDLGIRRELLAARARGVAIRVLSGGPYSDHGVVRRAGRRRYGQLLEAGVELHEYASHMLHSKVLVVDGRWCVVGSTNIDPRSFGLNDEVNLLVESPELAAQLRQMFEGDLERSERLDLLRWRNRPWSEKALATLGRLIERHQ